MGTRFPSDSSKSGCYRLDWRSPLKRLVVFAAIGALSAACTGGAVVDHSRPLETRSSDSFGASHGAVVRLQLIPIPEGPTAPSFERDAVPGDKSVRPLKSVGQYVPDPLPAPIQQPKSCSFGGNLVVTFADGFKLTYGPCKRPASINRLWAGMIYVLEDGNCAPKCGPGGSAGP